MAATPQMTPPSVASSLPEHVARLGRLELRAKHVVEGFLSGRHRSPYFGRSLDFRQHRPYVRGDDFRDVDWKVWARQDRLYVKQYEEDTNLRCSLLVDRSRSMAYGNGPMSKYNYAATAACVLAYLLLRQNDAVGCLTFDKAIAGQTPLQSSRSHLNVIAGLLEGEADGADSDFGNVLTLASAQLPKRGVVILLSDFFGDVAATAQGLSALRQRGHDLIVLHILDDDELDFPFDETTKFEGLETDASLQCNPRSLRDGYLEALAKFQTDIRAACLKQRADYALVRTSDPLDTILTTVLSSRLASRRKA